MSGHAIHNLNNFIYKNLKYIFLGTLFLAPALISSAYFNRPSCSNMEVKNLILDIHRNRAMERLFIFKIHQSGRINDLNYNQHIDNDLQFSIDAIETINWSPIRHAAMCKASVTAQIKNHGLSKQDIFFTIMERADHRLVANLLN